MADVAHHRAALDRLEHVGITHVHVAGGAYQQVGVLQQRLVDACFGSGVDAIEVRRHHFETVHAGLHGADWVGFGDLHDHAFLTQGSGRALAHIAVADDQRFLAGKQVVSGALDGVVQAVAAAVLVVVLGLGHCVVDVDGRHLQLAVSQHFLQAVYTGGGFFGHAVAVGQNFRILFVEQRRQVAAVVQNHVGFPAIDVGANGALEAPVVFFVGLTLPGENRDTTLGDSGGCLVLGREDVAR